MTKDNSTLFNYKVISAISIIALLYLFALSYLYIYNAKAILSNQINSYGHSLSRTIAISSIEDILSWNFPELNSRIEQIGDGDKQLLKIDIKHKNKIVASYVSPVYEPESVSEGDYTVVKFYSPIYQHIKSLNKEEFLGVVEIYLSQHYYQSFLIREQLKILFISSSLLLTVVLVSFFVYKILTDNLNIRD